MRVQIFRRNAFLLRPGFQRVCARKIRHGICLRGIGICAVRYRDCLPRPVSRMLMQPGQRVENAAFADVRVSGQRNGAERGFVPAHLTASTTICAASFFRSANTAPPTAYAAGDACGAQYRQLSSVSGSSPSSSIRALASPGIKISRRTPYSPGRSASSPIRRFSMGALPFLFLWFLIQNIQKSTVL